MYKQKGFTLVELLLVMGIAVIIFALTTPYGLNFYRNNLVEDARSNIIDALQQARHYAVLQKNDSAFGVFFATSTYNYTMFQGPSSSTRVTAQDEVFTFPSSITVTGLTDIVFAKLTGAPSATGTITLTDESVSDSILIDNSGIISEIN